MFSVDPILDLTPFRSGKGVAAVARGGRFFREPGDLGVERTTATFLTLFTSTKDFPVSAWPEGDLGVPGLLCPLEASYGGWESNGLHIFPLKKSFIGLL